MTLLSPGIEIKEKDLSAYISRAATGRAGTVGKFQWGPCFDLTQVTDEADLVTQFGLPDDNTFASFLSCVNFLKYANDLRIVRIVDKDTARNSSAEFDFVVNSAFGGKGYAATDKVQMVYTNVIWTKAHDSDNFATIKFGPSDTYVGAPIAVHESSHPATIALTESTPILSVLPESANIQGFTIACTSNTGVLSGTVSIYWPADHVAIITGVDGDGAITNMNAAYGGIATIATGNRYQIYNATGGIVTYAKPSSLPHDVIIGDITHSVIAINDIVRWDVLVGALPGSRRFFTSTASIAADTLSTPALIRAAIAAGDLVEDVMAHFAGVSSSDSSVYFGKPEDADNAIATATYDISTSHIEHMSRMNIPTIYAKYPGKYGDDIKVDLIKYEDFIDPLQKTIPIVLPVSMARIQQEINRSVFGIDGPQVVGDWAFIVYYKGDIVETHVCSTIPGAKDIYGRTKYITDYFAANASEYIVAVCGDEGYWPQNSMQVVFTGGEDGIPVEGEPGAWLEGWDMFTDPDTLYVNLLFAGGACNESEADSLIIQQYISQSVAEVRRDCLAFLSPAIATTTRKSAPNAVEAAVAYRGDLAINSSFAEGDSGQHKWQFDKYNDKKRWIANNADIAGLCAFTDRVAAPWNSPAGLNRGIIKGVIKLAYDAKKSLRDTLYEAQLNPIVFFPSEGYCLFGDKTLQGKPSAFDRINVRRLFNLLEKAIGDASKYKLFENNTAFTRRSFVTQVSAYLDTIKAQGGVIEYYVWCDERNNTPAVIDRNEFVGTIFIKPPRSINYITLNFVATATGANFEELISSQF